MITKLNPGQLNIEINLKTKSPSTITDDTSDDWFIFSNKSENHFICYSVCSRKYGLVPWS